MILLRVSTWFHKWIGLIVGIQVLFWVAGGVVMTVLPIEKVRSEHHVAETAPPPLQLDRLLPLADAAHHAGVSPVEAQLKSTPRGPVWSFKTVDGDPVVVSADTGAPLPRLTGQEARGIAAGLYKGEGKPVADRYFESAPPETGRTGPLWRVDFSDAERTSFYLAPTTGELVTRRSNVWRFYDFFWRLHIMDWKSGENFNHPLIIAASVLSLVIVITGFVLLWIRIGRDLAGLTRRRKPA